MSIQVKPAALVFLLQVELQVVLEEVLVWVQVKGLALVRAQALERVQAQGPERVLALVQALVPSADTMPRKAPAGRAVSAG